MWAQGENSKLGDVKNGITAAIVYAPMKNDKEYVPLSEDVFLHDARVLLPMHADLSYSEPCTGDEVQTRMRQYAHELIKHVCAYNVCD